MREPDFEVGCVMTGNFFEPSMCVSVRYMDPLYLFVNGRKKATRAILMPFREMC